MLYSCGNLSICSHRVLLLTSLYTKELKNQTIFLTSKPQLTKHQQDNDPKQTSQSASDQVKKKGEHCINKLIKTYRK